MERLGARVELIPISTKGDVKTGPLGDVGGQGLFTKEIQQALLQERVDLAVHSLKDLPTDPVEGLALAAVPPRESNRDTLLSNAFGSLDELPDGARVGTGSLRRRAQLLHHRPNVTVRDIRGNVETRLHKLDEGRYDAIILAEAGLRRLGLADRITQVIPADVMLPAVGQGALGIECRADDAATHSLLEELDDPTTHAAVAAERSMLASLRGGCMAPVGALCRSPSAGLLQLDGVVLSGDGTVRSFASAETSLEETPLKQAETLGRHVAEQLFDRGAAELIAQSRTA